MNKLYRVISCFLLLSGLFTWFVYAEDDNNPKKGAAGFLRDHVYIEDSNAPKIVSTKVVPKKSVVDFLCDQVADEYDKEGAGNNPSLAKAYYNRGVAYTKDNKYAEALNDFGKVVRISSNKELLSRSYYNRALIIQKRNDYNRAISNYTKAIEYNPEYAPSYKNRAVAYLLAKEYDKSWQDVHKSVSLGLEMNPEFMQALEAESGRVK